MITKRKIIIFFTLFFIIGSISIFYLYYHITSQKLENACQHSIHHLENELVPPDTAFQLMESNLPQLEPLLSQNPNENAQEILVNLKTILNASIVYIMDTDGTVIASTIYGDNETLLHNSYPFRPYFTKALHGEQTIYEAKGVTTQEKGIYYSVPIPRKTDISGVLVVKLNMEKIDYWIQKFEQISVLTNPDGIIFSTNVKEWAYRITKDIPEQRLTEIKERKQFANETLAELPFHLYANQVKIGKNRYLVKTAPIVLDGWECIILQKYNRNIPLLLSIFLFLFCLLSATNLIQYLILKQRLKTQRADLQQKEKDLSKSAKKFTAIYQSSVDAVMIMRDDAFIECNQKTLELFQAKKEEFIGDKPYNFSPTQQPDGRNSQEKAKEMIEKALHGENQLFEWQHKKLTGELFDAQISLNPYWENDEIFILAVVRDVTVQKKNERVQKALFQIANAVNITSNLRELFQSIRSSLQQVMDTSNFFIALYEKESDTITLPYQKDEKEELKKFPAGKSCTAYVIRTQKSLLATENELEQLIAEGKVEQIGPKSKVILMSPLFLDEEVIGVVTVQSYEDEHTYSPQDKNVLEFVSDEIATAIKKKQTEEEREIEKAYFEQLFEASPEAIAVCDEKGMVQKINKTFTALFLYTENEALGKSIDHLIGLEDSEDTFLKQIESGNVAELETNRKRKDGSIIPVSILQKPIFIAGDKQSVYSIYRDISDKKADEMEIESQKEHLQLINKILRHDLMNNLSVINSALKIFKRTQEMNFIDSAFQSIQSSLKLIKQMREMEDFISKHKHLRIYDAHDLIDRHISQSEHLKIENKAEGKMLADDSVESVINNLIHNVKNHAEAKHLLIRTETNQDKLLIHFMDDGKGIPDKIKSHIFEENFHYGKTGNTGLGLYIVKKAMESYGGYVSVENNQPKGTIFTLTFRTAVI